MSEIRHGDSLEVLREMADNTVDAVITDPPYGYSFMGKEWDKAVPSVALWAECLRVLKPGGWCLVMSAPRSDVQNAMISRLMEAGFRLDFTPIYWTYASGFPKSGNIGKMVDKRLGAKREVVGDTRYPDGSTSRKTAQSFQSGGMGKIMGDTLLTASASPEAKSLDGSYAGFQPKPAVEVVIVAMKPLSEKTYIDQALTNGKGITWLDDCRVPTTDDNDLKLVQSERNSTSKGQFATQLQDDQYDRSDRSHITGRFPANLLVSDDTLNGHSKFFDLDAWAETLPFLVVPKASKSEKNKGLDGFEVKDASARQVSSEWKVDNRHPDGGSATAPQVRASNHHPTVKPLKLMSYLITLTTRPGDTVIDPFVGSGTTVVAAEHMGRNGIGIERDPEYVEIAQARLSHVSPK